MRLKEIVSRLSRIDGCYIRQISRGRYCLAGSGVKLMGMRVDPIFYQRTFDALSRRGVIKPGRRIHYDTQHTGWFFRCPTEEESHAE